MYGTTLHNRHDRLHTPRTSFRPNLLDSEKSARQKAEGCVYAKVATHEIFPRPLSLLRALLLQISYYYVGRPFQMVLYPSSCALLATCSAGFAHERAVVFSTFIFQHFGYSTESGGKCRLLPCKCHFSTVEYRVETSSVAGISIHKASLAMAGVVVGVRVYGTVLGVLTTGKYIV